MKSVFMRALRFPILIQTSRIARLAHAFKKMRFLNMRALGDCPLTFEISPVTHFTHA
jgi:hypothetical protein